MKQVFLLFFVIISLSANAQTHKAFVKAGDNALAQDQHYDAYNHFRMAMKIDSIDVQLWGKLAKAAYGFNLFETADYYYQKIEKEGKSKEIYGFGENWLKTKIALGNYEAAQNIASQYKVSKANKMLNIAIQLKKKPIKIDIQHLPKNINTAYSDFAAQRVGEDLYYSSYRFKVTNEQNQKMYTSKLVVSKKGSRGLPIKDRFNTKGKSIANAFWQDENTVYYTICESINEKQQCAIYVRKREKGKWKTAQKLNPKINKELFTSTHPNIAFDSLANKTYLYFVSNRSGKMTIWRSELLKSGKWKSPTKQQFLDDRTATENVTPFFDNKTQTLYFSSDKNGGLGNLDIYKIKRKKGGWSKVKNAGFPLNGSYNDVYFRLNNDSKTGYFSSNRKGSLSLTKGACCYDIYAFELGDSTPEKPIQPTKPENPPVAITEVPEMPIRPSEPITITEIPIQPKEPLTPLEELSQFLPLALYFHNDEPNPKTWKTTTTIDYSTSYRSYYTRKNEYIRAFTESLSETKKITYTDDLNYFFDKKVKEGYDNLDAFSAVLLKHLQAGETIEIVLKGFASPRAKSDYNLNLSKRRVGCVRNYFRTYQGDTFQKYLNNGQLKIFTSPFGETKAATSVSDELDDKRNSVYSVGAAEERRVEILEVR
ncbi:MAG: outer membrane protein OmpA-like peptidoglycan-associated protein [Saprospiraceae bacterium]|jgi:outer membrane protein OmpA-like peptidoglycan-associated protein